MWGFNLIQFGSWGGKSFDPFMLNGEMKDNIYPIDRDYVKPELGLIVTTPSSVENGIDMLDKKFWTLYVGKTHDLGLMEYLAATILIKNNANTNWSEWAEIFGMDLKTVKTDKTDNARSQLLTALKNLGSNGYGVFSPEDEIEFAGTSRTDAYKVYENLIRYSDEQISKIIFGQDVVSNNNGRVVGEVGENIAKLYGNADAKFIKAQVNDKLLPFLTRIGAGNFEGYKFVYDTSEELTLTERSDIDLKISQMGKQHSDNYINDTYGVEVEAISTANDTAQVAEAIQNLYK
jgi:phage gp29-like protein